MAVLLSTDTTAIAKAGSTGGTIGKGEVAKRRR
jgi:hypothetical protein